MGLKSSTLLTGLDCGVGYAAAIVRHLLRYRASEILNVCPIYVSGFFDPLALYLPYSFEPLELEADRLMRSRLRRDPQLPKILDVCAIYISGLLRTSGLESNAL